MNKEFKKETHAEYLDDKSCVSASMLKNFLVSPRHYLSSYEDEQKEISKALRLGTAIHVAILETSLFNSMYLVMPSVDKRTVEGKRIYAEFEAKAEGKIILLEKEYDIVVNCAKSAIADQTVLTLLSNSEKEISVYATDKKTGLNIKMRPDVYSNTKDTISDLKTTESATHNAFIKQIVNYGYDISAALYCDFCEKSNYVFIAIEKTPPYLIGKYLIDDEWIQYGRSKYRMALDLLKWAIDNDHWCDYREFKLLKSFYIEYAEGCNLPTLEEFKTEAKKLENQIEILPMPSYLKIN